MGQGDVRGSALSEENLVLWDGVREAFAAVVNNLLGAKELRFVPVPALAYGLDGEVLKLRVAKGPPARAYEESGWLPAARRPGCPSPEEWLQCQIQRSMRS